MKSIGVRKRLFYETSATSQLNIFEQDHIESKIGISSENLINFTNIIVTPSQNTVKYCSKLDKFAKM